MLKKCITTLAMVVIIVSFVKDSSAKEIIFDLFSFSTTASDQVEEMQVDQNRSPTYGLFLKTGQPLTVRKETAGFKIKSWTMLKINPQTGSWSAHKERVYETPQRFVNIPTEAGNGALYLITLYAENGDLSFCYLVTEISFSREILGKTQTVYTSGIFFDDPTRIEPTAIQLLDHYEIILNTFLNKGLLKPEEAPSRNFYVQKNCNSPYHHIIKDACDWYAFYIEKDRSFFILVETVHSATGLSTIAHELTHDLDAYFTKNVAAWAGEALASALPTFIKETNSLKPQSSYWNRVRNFSSGYLHLSKVPSHSTWVLPYYWAPFLRYSLVYSKNLALPEMTFLRNILTQNHNFQTETSIIAFLRAELYKTLKTTLREYQTSFAVDYFFGDWDPEAPSDFYQTPISTKIELTDGIVRDIPLVPFLGMKYVRLENTTGENIKVSYYIPDDSIYPKISTTLLYFKETQTPARNTLTWQKTMPKGGNSIDCVIAPNSTAILCISSFTDDAHGKTATITGRKAEANEINSQTRVKRSLPGTITDITMNRKGILFVASVNTDTDTGIITKFDRDANGNWTSTDIASYPKVRGKLNVAAGDNSWYASTGDYDLSDDKPSTGKVWNLTIPSRYQIPYGNLGTAIDCFSVMDNEYVVIGIPGYRPDPNCNPYSSDEELNCGDRYDHGKVLIFKNGSFLREVAPEEETPQIRFGEQVSAYSTGEDLNLCISATNGVWEIYYKEDGGSTGDYQIVKATNIDPPTVVMSDQFEITGNDKDNLLYVNNRKTGEILSRIYPFGSQSTEGFGKQLVLSKNILAVGAGSIIYFYMRDEDNPLSWKPWFTHKAPEELVSLAIHPTESFLIYATKSRLYQINCWSNEQGGEVPQNRSATLINLKSDTNTGFNWDLIGDNGSATFSAESKTGLITNISINRKDLGKIRAEFTIIAPDIAEGSFATDTLKITIHNPNGLQSSFHVDFVFVNNDFYAEDTDSEWYKSIDPKPTIQKLLGDYNIDDKVDLADAILALQIMAGINEHSIYLPNDPGGVYLGKVDMGDVSYILQKTSGVRD